MNEGISPTIPPAVRADDCGAGRRRDREATKGALLDAAKEVFAARGFDAATTRDIATRAGVNEQLIQRYFQGKAGLLLAIVERFGREEGRGCTMPPPCANLEDDLATFLHHQVTHAWACRDFTKVVLDRALVDPAVAAEMGRTLSETRIPGLLARLETFQARGDIDPAADLPAVAAGMVTLSFGLGFFDQVVFAEDPEGVYRVARALARTLARGLAPVGADTVQAPAGADTVQAPVGADTVQAPAGADVVQAPAGAVAGQAPLRR